MLLFVVFWDFYWDSYYIPQAHRILLNLIFDNYFKTKYQQQMTIYIKSLISILL